MKQILFTSFVFILSSLLGSCAKEVTHQQGVLKFIDLSVSLETKQTDTLTNINCYVFVDNLFYTAFRNITAKQNRVEMNVPETSQLFFLTNTQEPSSFTLLEKSKTPLAAFVLFQNDPKKTDSFYSGTTIIHPSTFNYQVVLTSGISHIDLDAGDVENIRIDSVQIEGISATTSLFEIEKLSSTQEKHNYTILFEPALSGFAPDIVKLYESDTPVRFVIHGMQNNIPVIAYKTLDKLKRNRTYSLTINEEEVVIKKENIHQFYADSRGRLDIEQTEASQIKPGDILFLRDKLLSVKIVGLKGTADKPIRITNYPGETLVVGNPAWSGGAYSNAILLLDCQHVIIGSDDNASRFRIEGSIQPTVQESYFGVSLGNFTDNVEVKNMMIFNGGTGIMAKTNPELNDPKTWHPNTLLENLSIHDIHISNNVGEAMYIGHTSIYWGWDENGKGYNAGTNPTNPEHTYAQPVRWKNVKINNNRMENAGSGGIQASSIDQLEIDGNTISNFGLNKTFGHCMGILVGGNSTNTYIHDNYVHDGFGECFQFHGANGNNSSSHRVHNNLFVNTESSGMGIYGLTDATTIHISNNTIANCYAFAVQANGKGFATKVELHKNLYIACYLQDRTSNRYIRTMNGAVVEQIDDKQFKSVTEALVDENNFYSPLPGSPVGDAGYSR